MASADFTEAQLARYRKAFDAVDTDKSGSISSAELANVLKELGIQLKDEEVAEVMKMMDKDGSGSIEWEEFLAAIKAYPRRKLTVGRLRRAFKKIDTDGSGTLGLDEIKELIKKLGLEKEVTDADIEEGFKALDTSGDGQISFEEFLEAFKKKK